MPREVGSRWVAIVLAIGIATALNVITFGVLIDALRAKGPGLSDNATQVLTMGFSGIIGVLGSYVGFKLGQQNGKHEPPERPDVDEETDVWPAHE